MDKITKAQLNDVIKVVKLQQALFFASNFHPQTLTEEDYQVLKKAGIDPKVLAKEFTPFEQAFYFGRVVALLANRASIIDYNDFMQYLRRGEFLPNTAVQNEALRAVEKRAYTYITKLGEKIVDTIQNQAADPVTAPLIKQAIKTAIEKNQTVRDIVSFLGNKTQDWNRDFGRIGDTELQNAYQVGQLSEYLRMYGSDVLVYKDVMPGACRHCVELYLTNGVGSKPRLFTAQQLLQNGINIWRRVKDWKPTLESLHPHCRCQLHHAPKGAEWSKEKQDFVYPANVVEEAKKIQGKIKVTVGTRKFVI
jgi:hypothetical protein